jgi:hypothetical protein
MKKTKLKKQTKKGLKSIETKLDREYQDEIRLICWEYDIRCEISNEIMELCHHYIEKSKSGALRYNLINFVPIIQKVHCAIHMSKGDSTNSNKIVLRRGIKWALQIEILRNTTISKDWKYYSDARCQLEWIKEHRKEVADSYFKYGYFKVVNK